MFVTTAAVLVAIIFFIFIAHCSLTFTWRAPVGLE